MENEKSYKIDFFKKTDIGKIRKVNQDFAKYGNLSDGVSAYGIVCDGIGSSEYGGLAAEIAVNGISSLVESRLTPDFFSTYSRIDEALHTIIAKVNSEVCEQSKLKKEFMRMGTTAVFALIKDNVLHVVNVGDSRCYVLNKNSIKQVSIDHSVVQKLIDMGEITKEESRVYPQKNLITRALGIEETVNEDYFTQSLENFDGVLLCSDGLTNHVTDAEILEIFVNSELQNFCDNLINSANENGGSDNITALFMHKSVKNSGSS